jgi:3-deoxy-7-phosphoheptulonate synthase
MPSSCVADPVLIGEGDCSLTLGGGSFAIIAGPCAVESLDSLTTIADAVVAAGATALRGGAFKPRTSPYSFQGLGEAGLEMLSRVRERARVPVITEALDVRHVEQVAATADVVQIGARNMSNVPLLREAGAAGKPVLLKRSFAATVDELLHAADYVVDAGCDRLVLCERGIRTFEQSTRFTLDLGAVPVLRARTGLPVVVDPSHAAGNAAYVPALARAALAAGADAVMVEVHEAPHCAQSDGAQSLSIAAFAEMARDLMSIAEAMGRSVTRPGEAPAATGGAATR